MQEIMIIAYTSLAGQLAYQLSLRLNQREYLVKAYLFKKYKVAGCMPFADGKQLVGEAFKRQEVILFICAAGIAVRLITPFVTSKISDSPVIVMDEKGEYTIPILSGHLGGANRYARLFAGLTGGVPVITTATDIHHKFAVDLFAQRNQLYISDMEKAKNISAKVLQGEAWENQYVISCDMSKETDEKLLLVPKQLIIGIGCKKGISLKQIEEAIHIVLKEKNLHPKAIFKLCSIDLKKEEQGIIAFCEKYQIVYETFSAQELLSIEGAFHSSPFVESITGVGNVCERSAMAGCRGKGELIVSKQKMSGITLAIAKVPLPKFIYK